MEPTHLLYLEDFTCLESNGTVVTIEEVDGKQSVILNQTIFYPQGGGQPYDQGEIKNEAATFLVNEVRFIDGIVKHYGQFHTGVFLAGDVVVCKVNKERRELHSRLHSAGHMIDMAVQSLGLSWIPGKGYHFPDGPYVEYAGSINGFDKEKLMAQIEKACNDIVATNLSTKILFMEKEQMHTVCHFVPEFLPEGKPGRVVLFGDFGVPCGGTHVSTTTEIKSMTIRKIKAKGDTIQIGYDVER